MIEKFSYLVGGSTRTRSSLREHLFLILERSIKDAKIQSYAHTRLRQQKIGRFSLHAENMNGRRLIVCKPLEKNSDEMIADEQKAAKKMK